MPRYFLETFGCQMNERDSETIRGLVEGLGFVPAERMVQADLILFNTCSVREKPHHKVFSRLGDLRALKQQRPELIIAVCGCMAQIIPQEIAARAPFVDLILGPRNLADLPRLIGARQGRRSDGPAVATDNRAILPEGLPACRAPGVAGFVNIAYGCDNFCAYCVVPHARGPEVSRRPEEILAEAREAVAQGFLDITLLGQNVNSYGHDLQPLTDFAELLAEVSAIEGLRRLRFTTSHPKDCSPRLLDAMRDLEPVCEQLHLPLQAGDDEVLARMGRGYTYAHYRGLVEQARARMPSLAVTTDLMVGFPGETEAQFEHTLQACEEIRFDQAFMFKYNDRPGTAAAQTPDKVSEEAKQQRLVRLVKLQNTIGREINQQQVGEVFEVLVEGPDPKTPDLMRGRTRQNKLMIFPGEGSLVGRLVEVRVEEGYVWGFKGRPVTE